jgi:ankyrin repeat domain-containing protein 50
VKQLYERSSYGKQQAKLSELKETLLKVIESLDQVFIIIDALDECRKDVEREQLLTTILEIKSRSLPSLHILTTSRRELDIEEALLPLITIPAIPVEGSQIDLDIKLYISWRLAIDQQLRKWPKAIKAEIEESLIAGANGM